MNRSHIIVCTLLIAAAALATMACYASLPATVPTHWGIDGKPDGYSARGALWLLGPGLMAAVLAIGLGLPSLSPRQFGIAPFRGTYSYFISLIVGMLAYVYAAVLYAILGSGFDLPRTVYLGLFVLLILLGNPMGKVKRNFFIGVRTPWTLASERVWHATHRLCAQLMVASGMLGLVAVLVDAGPGWHISLLSGWCIIVIVFSLIYYKRLERDGRLDPGRAEQ